MSCVLLGHWKTDGWLSDKQYPRGRIILCQETTDVVLYQAVLPHIADVERNSCCSPSLRKWRHKGSKRQGMRAMTGRVTCHHGRTSSTWLQPSDWNIELHGMSSNHAWMTVSDRSIAVTTYNVSLCFYCLLFMFTFVKKHNLCLFAICYPRK